MQGVECYSESTVKDRVKGPPDSSAQGRGSAGGARERGRADERSTRDLASALMLRPPSPAVSRFRREQGERRAPRRSPQRRLRRTSDEEGTKIQSEEYMSTSATINTN